MTGIRHRRRHGVEARGNRDWDRRGQRVGQKGTESGGTEGMGVNLGKKKTEMGENRRGNMGRGGEDDADQRRSAERGGNRQQ